MKQFFFPVRIKKTAARALSKTSNFGFCSSLCFFSLLKSKIIPLLSLFFTWNLFFTCWLCPSFGLCFSVKFGSLLRLGYYSWLGWCFLLLLIQTNTWTLFFTQNLFFIWICFFTQTSFFIKSQICFSLRSVLNSLCFPLRICSSLRLWSSTEFGFLHEFIIFHLDVIFKSVYSSFRSYSLFGNFFFTKTLLHTNSATCRLFSSTNFYYSF